MFLIEPMKIDLMKNLFSHNLLCYAEMVYSNLSVLTLWYVKTGKSKEAEIKRINKELANIRSKFKGDKTLDGYQKKKYVCKLLFIFLLGHDIDFGHMEAVNLLSSNKYSEKQIVSEIWIIFFTEATDQVYSCLYTG